MGFREREKAVEWQIFSAIQVNERGGFGVNKRDWMVVKNEYITGRDSLQKLADKHKIPLRTIKDRSAREKWVEGRKNFRAETAQKAVRKTMKREVSRLVKLQEVAEDVAELIKEDIERLKELHKKRQHITESDVKMIKDLTAALKNIAEIMREVYAIPTIREKIMMDKYEDYKKTLEGLESGFGGVIILPDVAEREGGTDEGAGKENCLEAAAETD